MQEKFREKTLSPVSSFANETHFVYICHSVTKLMFVYPQELRSGFFLTSGLCKLKFQQDLLKHHNEEVPPPTQEQLSTITRCRLTDNEGDIGLKKYQNSAGKQCGVMKTGLQGMTRVEIQFISDTTWAIHLHPPASWHTSNKTYFPSQTSTLAAYRRSCNALHCLLLSHFLSHTDETAKITRQSCFFFFFFDAWSFLDI